ncbi:MAG TPA: hypothetical protein VJ898_13970 [Natrialbaceae archaeon]|nr:hypothetical protein [Natrialbaceae archaeon]
MASVTRSRFFQADPETVERLIADDVVGFMKAAGFDSVSVEEDCLEIERRLGLANLSLTLRPIDGEEATLAFEQEAGLFEAMTMQYFVEPTAGGTELEARTEFTLGGVVGSVLDETLVRRQRKSELEDQFDYLERALED